jgi:lipoprotein NlpD
MGGPWPRSGGAGNYSLSKLTYRIVALVCVVVLAGCAGGRPVPVKDHSQGVTQPTHRAVRSGDTLYSIAWDVGVDFQTLARWNRIDPPYVIKPGQRLRTIPPVSPAHAPNRPRYRAPKAAAPKSRPPPPRRPQSTTRAWIWPTEGRIIAGFSPRAGRKGIDISGKYGQTIRSAAAGRVVYAGAGLRGYGKLIIVKHNETFLSAYAHNRKLLVKEGNQVTRGEKIAEMGRSGSNRVKLHFEIRRRGSPVDPTRYLPQR